MGKAPIKLFVYNRPEKRKNAAGEFSDAAIKRVLSFRNTEVGEVYLLCNIGSWKWCAFKIVEDVNQAISAQYLPYAN